MKMTLRASRRNSRSAAACGRTGFTLVELLLVLAIVGVITAVTLPNLVRSLRGNRLTVAARTVVMAGRYARSMAVLKQEEVTVTFTYQTEGKPATVSVSGKTIPNLTRPLEGVTLQVEGKDAFYRKAAKETEPTLAAVVYRSNGRCVRHTVQLADPTDERHSGVKIDVDELGEAETAPLAP